MRIASCVVRRQRAEAEPHQRMAAVRNLAAHRLEGQRREVFLGAHGIERLHHVLRGVEQRAVEIEQHALDDARSWRPADRRFRCMR